MSAFDRHIANQVAATAATPYANLQDWLDDLDALGALASRQDLTNHLMQAPAGVDLKLIEMIEDAIAGLTVWPPEGYRPGARAQTLIRQIEEFEAPRP